MINIETKNPQKEAAEAAPGATERSGAAVTTASPAPGTGKTDIDILLKDLAVPKQQFFTPEQQQQQQQQPAAPFFQEQPPAEFDPEAAKRAGRRAAVLSNAVLSFGAAVVAKSSDTEPYSASEGETNDLAEAWGAVAEKYSFEVNPWISVIFLTLTIYAPKYMAAFNDRRFNKMQDEINSLREEQQKIIEEIQRAKDEAEKAKGE